MKAGSIKRVLIPRKKRKHADFAFSFSVRKVIDSILVMKEVTVGVGVDVFPQGHHFRR